METLIPFFPLVFVVCLVLTLSFGFRIILAIFFTRYRNFIGKRPWMHLGWLLLSAATLFQLIDFQSPKRYPGRYHSSSGPFYWQVISNGVGKELMRKDGIIFFYIRGRHGPSFKAIREEDAAASRQDALRGVVDSLVRQVDRPISETRMTRLALLTHRNDTDINSFRAWWEREGADFVFDEEAHQRLRNYNYGEGNPDERFRYYEKIEREERELILRGKYKTNLTPKPAAPAPPHPPAQY
jgi:hypothetical protein